MASPAFRRGRARGVGAAAVAAAALIVLWGGYDRHWRWTGFQSHDTLWDWLELLVLPIAVAIVPLWARRRHRMDRTRRALIAAAATAFVVLVVVGYAADLRWTGFPGNRLWDWLELLVLPFAIVMIPVWWELEHLRPRTVALLAAAALALTVVALGGYLAHWRWTGFQGNTLYDWLRLFLAPLLLPLLFIPAARSWLTPDDDSDDRR